MEKQPVEGHSNLFRDRMSKAIISTDEAARLQYLNRKKSISANYDRLVYLENRIAELEAKVDCLLRRIS